MRMHPEGWRFVLPLLVVGVVAGSWWHPALVLCGLGPALFVVWFFRDPHRTDPADDPAAIVAPADGRVCAIVENATLPPGTERDDDEQAAAWTRVSIFMTVLNVHVNRAPIAGRMVARVYRHGRFFNASLDKASEQNEQLALRLHPAATPDGPATADVVMVQIAGLVARRIVSFVGLDVQVSRGQRVGLIRFGSRVDVYLPAGVDPQIAMATGPWRAKP